MSKIISLIVAAVIIVAGIIFVPKLAHTCDSCDKFFVGVGYERNMVSSLIAEEDGVICKECAELEHAVSIALGKSVEEFKRDLF